MAKAQSPILSFENTLPPQLFIEKASTIGSSPNYPSFSLTENGFSVQVNANHGGQVYFDCEVLPNENGGSTINGKVFFTPWNSAQTKGEKIREWIVIVLVYIILFPITICLGIDMLFFRLSKKRKLTSDEKKAIDFMTKNLNCTYKEIIEDYFTGATVK